MMRAKYGNLTVNVWEIDKKNDEDWVEKGIQEGKIGWRSPFVDVEKLGDIPKADPAKAERFNDWKNLTIFGKTSPKADAQDFASRIFAVKGGYGGTFGLVGDYLIYSEALPNHYQVIPKDKAAKELTFIEEV